MEVTALQMISHHAANSIKILVHAVQAEPAIIVQRASYSWTCIMDVHPQLNSKINFHGFLMHFHQVIVLKEEKELIRQVWISVVTKVALYKRLHSEHTILPLISRVTMLTQ
uniref:Cholesterol transport protein n=1 Tax=Arundo donax TaxID=35708 RepID=A0A0A9ECL1_ARUDO